MYYPSRNMQNETHINVIRSRNPNIGLKQQKPYCQRALDTTTDRFYK